jgi:hypothetical protein
LQTHASPIRDMDHALCHHRRPGRGGGEITQVRLALVCAVVRRQLNWHRRRYFAQTAELTIQETKRVDLRTGCFEAG